MHARRAAAVKQAAPAPHTVCVWLQFTSGGEDDPLMQAVATSQPADLVDALIHAGGDPLVRCSCRGAHGRDLPSHRVRGGGLTRARVVVPQIIGTAGNTVLHAAAATGAVDTVKLLLRRGTNVHTVNKAGEV